MMKELTPGLWLLWSAPPQNMLRAMEMNEQKDGGQVWALSHLKQFPIEA